MPLTMVEGTPPGDALPPPPQRATPARKGACCGAGAGSPRPHRRHPGHTGRGTLAARSRGQAAGGGTAPDTRRLSQWWKAPPTGAPFRHPHSEQRRPAGAHAVGQVLGPHARTDCTRDRRVAEPRLPAPEDRRPREGQRLPPDAPHNGGRPTPTGDSPPPPPRYAAPKGHAGQGDSVGPPHSHTRAHSSWLADPNSPPSGRAVEGGTAPDLRRPSQWWKAPTPGTPLRQAHREQRRPAKAHAVGPVLGPHACTDRTRDTQVAEPWLPAPEDARPGEGQRLTPDAPHNVGRPPPPGTAPGQPRGTQPPQGMQAKGTVLGPHTRAHSTWVADPNSPPSGQAVGEGTAPDLRRSSQWLPGTPPGDVLPPVQQRATPARKGAHCGARAGSARPHRPHLEHTGRGTLAARSRGRAAGGGTAPDTRRPSHRGKPHLPGTAPPPLSLHAAPTGHSSQGDSVGPPHSHSRAHSTWVADPNSPPSGQAVGGGTAPDLRRPSQWWKAPPPGTPLRHPHREQRRPARAHAVGPVLGPHARTDRGRDTRIAEPWLPAPEDGRPGEGQRLTPDASHNGGRHPPRGRPSATPTASNAGPQGRTLWGRCWVPTPAPTAPGTHGSRNPGCPLQRTGGRGRDSACHQTPLTTVAGHPSRGQPPTTPAVRSPHKACRPRGQYWAPTPKHPRPQHVGGGPQQPAQWGGSQGRDGA